MDINSLITHYGYAALILGSLAEGETVTLLGGIAAHQRLLSLPLTIISVALGGMIGDQLLYLAGRRYGETILQRFPRYRGKITRARRLINRHPWLFVVGSRFMYGFRIVGPILIGASRLPPKIFLPLNIIGALVWATLFTLLGYMGGEIIISWLHMFDKHMKLLFWLGLAIAAVWLVRLWLKRRTHRHTDENGSEDSSDKNG
ncbi:DedA family protein [Apirhabdus apintestini]|nr:DedA family protein [Enterobacteriaceae bacterium CA-0114]